MAVLTAPIFVTEGLDIRMFQSPEEAERWLEPWWVREDRGKVYDAEGRLLKLKVGDKRVIILSWEAEPVHAEDLRALLSAFLQITHNEKFENRALPDLIDAFRSSESATSLR